MINRQKAKNLKKRFRSTFLLHKHSVRVPKKEEWKWKINKKEKAIQHILQEIKRKS